MTETGPACIVCGSTEWMPLPDVGGGRSVTTAGKLILEPIAKSQCRVCALVQRTGERFLARTGFYEKDYSFYERPGAARFDRERYAAMAHWIRKSVPGEPATVLDAGCGRGWMMEAMGSLFPHARFSGIEPSEGESARARERGLDVTSVRIGKKMAISVMYDLIYSTNVLEHTESPTDFLVGLEQLLAPDGQIVITCPDASEPNQEVMFSDQNFSFLPTHLDALAVQAGLEVIVWKQPPAHVSLRDKQLVVLRKHSHPRRAFQAALDWTGVNRLYQRRRDYFSSWRICDEMLSYGCRFASHVYNFGTSTWGFLLAGYCPEYWNLVTSCMIDGGSGEFLGKAVSDAGQVTLIEGDVIVMGVDPETQQQFAGRFASTPAKLIIWNGIISR